MARMAASPPTSSEENGAGRRDAVPEAICRPAGTAGIERAGEIILPAGENARREAIGIIAGRTHRLFSRSVAGTFVIAAGRGGQIGAVNRSVSMKLASGLGVGHFCLVEATSRMPRKMRTGGEMPCRQGRSGIAGIAICTRAQHRRGE